MSESKIENILQWSAEEARDRLPSAFDQLSESGIGKALGEHAGLLSKIIEKLIEIDAAKFLSGKPRVADQFMDLLWEGVGGLASKSEELSSILARTRDLSVNFEASDSPLGGHFRTRGGRLSGASGLLHFKDQDFRYFGQTEVLLRFLVGKLPLGASNPWLLSDGIGGFPPLIGPIIKGITRLMDAK